MAVANELVESGLMRVEDAADFLGLSRTYLYLLMDRGELPYAKIGRSRRIPRNAVRDLAQRSIVERA